MANAALELLKDSVQFEPLCEFLAEYAAPPQLHGMSYTTEERKRAWKLFFRWHFMKWEQEGGWKY